MSTANSCGVGSSGFTSEMIGSTLDVAIDTSNEKSDEVEGMQVFREESYLDYEDMATVESHTMVEKDEDTGEPIRSQMVYVDEHTCIGKLPIIWHIMFEILAR